MNRPSLDSWLEEARSDPSAQKCGSFLVHNGVVRSTPKSEVRGGEKDGKVVTEMGFSYDRAAIEAAVEETKALPGIYYVRIWLNEGKLKVGDDIMLILIGGDIRPRVAEALAFLLGEVKGHCVKEEEIYQK